MSESDRYPFIVVDGSSYLFRAYHAMPDFRNAAGEPTGAVYGVLNMLRSLREQYKPDWLVVVFDAPGKTFRNDLYSEYKANRPPMPEELRSQIEPIHAIVRAQGWPLLMVSDVEADDVIGTLCKQATEAKVKTLVSTGDKDLAQLVNPYVHLINTMKNEVLDEASVLKKFGVPPSGIIDYLTLMGDTVDNIPGVPKVGPKTAAKLLNEHGSLDGVIAAADGVKGKLGENLRNAIPHLPLSKELATIRCELELEAQPTDLVALEPDAIALRDWYGRMNLRSWLAELDAEQGVTAVAGSDQGSSSATAALSAAASAEVEYDCITEQADFDAWLQRLQQAELIAFDTETDSLNYMQARIVGVSFAVQAGEAAYVPLLHDYPGAPEQLDATAVLAALKPLLEDADKAKVGQHLKFDAHVLQTHGIHLQGIEHDTMLASYVLNSTASRHDMDSLAAHYLNRSTVKFEDVCGKGAKQITFNQVELEIASQYAAEDADITLQLHQHLAPQLEQQAALQKVYAETEIPLVPVLTAIEHGGVLLDTDALHEQSGQLSQRLIELEQLAHTEAGQPFKLSSPKQLQEILFDKLEIPVVRKTPKGAPSTAEDVLQELANDYALPKLILEHRSLSKLKSTYTDKLPLQVDSKTGRVHTSYHQAVAATGRLSSADPNLQNIPIRTAEGRRIREAFIAPEGRCLLAADYSQIELRIMAHLSGDEGLLRAFNDGLDVHSATAAEVFAVALGDVSTEQRRSAKAINFGLIYGMSAFGLAKQLGVERGQAQEYIDLYFSRYPGVKQFMDDIRKQAAEQGFVETLFGRRLYLPEINSRNGMRRQHAERTAINAPMQGTAADIIKRAMIDVHGWLQAEKIPANIVMQVHDELVLEVDLAEQGSVAEQLIQRMQNAAQLSVPLIVDCGRGANWDEAH